MKQTRSKLILILPILVAATSFTVFILAVVNGWMGPPQGVGRSFCESCDGLIKQPGNTWSNFAFIASGLLIAWLMWRGAYSSNHNTFTQTTFTPIFFSSLVILVGPCSMAMHATMTRIGGAFDLLSMFLISAFLMAYALQRFFAWRPREFTIVFAAVLATSEWAGALHHDLHLISGRTAFLVVIAIAVIFEVLNSYLRKLQHEIKWLAFGLLLFGVALVFWSLCRTGSPLCNPRSPLQGHAAWHLLDALSLFFLFRFYVSERRVGA